MTGKSDAMAATALAYWGAGGVAPRLVKERENIVYDVRLADGSRAALRLHRPGYQSRTSIEAELAWARALAGAGFPVPEPLATRKGAWTAQAGGRIASCVRWIDGAPLGNAETPLTGSATEQAAAFRALGRFVARLHITTDGLGLPADLDRHRWDEAGFLGPRPLWGSYDANPVLTPDDRRLMDKARVAALAELAAYRAEGADFGLIHADMLRENVLQGADGLALIDFDDSGWGFRLYDLATALFQSLEEPFLPALATALVEGYREERPLPAHAARRLLLFVMLRTFASMGWITTRAEPFDPRLRFYAERALRMARMVQAGQTQFA